MAHVKTVHLSLGDSKNGGETLNFTYKINVNVDGIFTTTLPEDVGQKLYDEKIYRMSNQRGKYGYFKSETCAELEREVKKFCNELLSKWIVSETIIIRYAIQTSCSYAKTADGEIVPNLTYTNCTGWLNGNVVQHAASSHPYGVMVYVQICKKVLYRYRSGKETAELLTIHDKKCPDLYSKWINNISSICPPKHTKIQEIEYTEEIGKFFVNLIKSICTINEKLTILSYSESLRELTKTNSLPKLTQ